MDKQPIFGLTFQVNNGIAGLERVYTINNGAWHAMPAFAAWGGGGTCPRSPPLDPPLHSLIRIQITSISTRKVCFELKM